MRIKTPSPYREIFFYSLRYVPTFLSPRKRHSEPFKHRQAPLTSTVGFMRIQLGQGQPSLACPLLGQFPTLCPPVMLASGRTTAAISL